MRPMVAISLQQGAGDGARAGQPVQERRGVAQKHGLDGLRAAVYLVVDYSGSMKPYYRDGSVQALADRVLGLSAHLDDDGTVPVVFFSTDVDAVTDIVLADHQGRIERFVAGLGHMGKTELPPGDGRRHRPLPRQRIGGARPGGLPDRRRPEQQARRRTVRVQGGRAAAVLAVHRVRGPGQQAVRLPPQARRAGGSGQAGRRQRRVLPRRVRIRGRCPTPSCTTVSWASSRSGWWRRGRRGSSGTPAAADRGSLPWPNRPAPWPTPRLHGRDTVPPWEGSDGEATTYGRRRRTTGVRDGLRGPEASRRQGREARRLGGRAARALRPGQGQHAQGLSGPLVLHAGRGPLYSFLMLILTGVYLTLFFEPSSRRSSTTAPTRRSTACS